MPSPRRRRASPTASAAAAAEPEFVVNPVTGRRVRATSPIGRVVLACQAFSPQRVGAAGRKRRRSEERAAAAAVSRLPTLGQLFSVDKNVEWAADLRPRASLRLRPNKAVEVVHSMVRSPFTVEVRFMGKQIIVATRSKDWDKQIAEFVGTGVGGAVVYK